MASPPPTRPRKEKMRKTYMPMPTLIISVRRKVLRLVIAMPRAMMEKIMAMTPTPLLRKMSMSNPTKAMIPPAMSEHKPVKVGEPLLYEKNTSAPLLFLTASHPEKDIKPLGPVNHGMKALTSTSTPATRMMPAPIQKRAPRVLAGAV